MALFLSTFMNKIDRKGRVSVPAPFRATLSQSTFQGIVVFRSFKCPALEGCGMERMLQLSESVDRLDLFSDAQDDFAATLFADAEQLIMDNEGRILMSEGLRDFAKIEEVACFVGRGATFQIWNPQDFERYQSAARARIKEQKETLRLELTASRREN